MSIQLDEHGDFWSGKSNADREAKGRVSAVASGTIYVRAVDLGDDDRLYNDFLTEHGVNAAGWALNVPLSNAR